MACTSRSISSRVPVADHRPAVVVHLEHQLLGLLLVVAEVLGEHVGHVGHQVDRVVPHDGHPRRGQDRDLVGPAWWWARPRPDLLSTRAHRGTRPALVEAGARPVTNLAPWHGSRDVHEPPDPRPLLWPRDVDGPAHRPLRADHAPGGAGERDGAPALGLRAVPAAAAGGPPLRRRGRGRPGARRASRTSASTTRPRWPRSRASSTSRRSSGWRPTASPATSGATPRARPTSRTRRC